MLKYREYNSRPYALQCFIEWVQNIENATSEGKKIERVYLNWKLIELDLNRCAKNAMLRHKIWRPMPLKNEGYLRGYQNPEAGKIYEQYKEKNMTSFAERSSIVDYILNGTNSPIEKMYWVDGVYCNDEKDNYYIHPSNLFAIGTDAVHILKLLVKCNILFIDDISSRKRTTVRINGQTVVKSEYITIGETLQKEVMRLLKHQSHHEFMKECIDCLVLIDEKNTEFNMKLNTFAQIIYDEKDEQWNCKCFSNMHDWVPLKSKIWETLLFRGIKPFQCETFPDTKWMELFIHEYTICTQSKNTDNLEALVSPFIIYPYFIKAKYSMKRLLMEYIDIFHEDCIYVILSYVFPDDMVYTNCYNEYSEQSAIKAVEFLSCLKIINDSVSFTASQEEDLFLRRYSDDIGCIKYCFDHFQEKSMELMDIMYVYKLLTKYTLLPRMSIDFHYKFLKKVIRVGADGYHSQFYYTCKGKRRQIPKLELFQSYISSLNREMVGKVFNYSNKNVTLLMEATTFKHLFTCNNDHFLIIRFMVNHKSVDINNDFVLKEMNANVKVFETAVENKRINVISVLLQSKKISSQLICKTILYHLRTRTYERHKYRDRNKVKSIQRFLNLRARKFGNPRERKMLTRTAKMLKKWLKRPDYVKYCVFTFNNECV
eukprot:442375_1